jgi:signal transduction histidine kinase
LDKDKIKHVIINMLLNAFQATQGQEQRIVRITTRNITFRFEAGIEIQIKDTGCGLPKGKEDRIFEPFFTTKEKHGTGLGLPISKDMIERHGGTLEIANNTDGPGATVTIRLPVKAKVLI